MRADVPKPRDPIIPGAGGTARRPPAVAGGEASRAVPGRHSLFGDVQAAGLSFEWHDFTTAEAVAWTRASHPGSLELCLNLEGRAAWTAGGQTIDLRPRMSLYYSQGDPPLTASRLGGGRHRFLTVEFAPEFLREHLGGDRDHLHPSILGVLEGTGRGSMIGLPEPMGMGVVQLIEGLQRCPVFRSAQATWFRCKALELAAQLFFRPPEGELFCTRQQRGACERAARVRGILQEQLADPPTLEELGRRVGCSPFYLSRQFSEATGLTIQQFLRQARLERAADLLRTGDYNVTEAALEVGYSSLSHFSVAFREMFGCCPGLYPHGTVPGFRGTGRATGSGGTRGDSGD